MQVEESTETFQKSDYLGYVQVLHKYKKKKSLTKLLVLTKLVRVKGLEPPQNNPIDPKSIASTNSAILAKIKNGGPRRTRTFDRPVMSRML